MYIHYDSYRIFYYVAKYRSFTQAAAMLLCNQPNVTRTIKNLESDLGCALFIRSNRGVRLTPEGERLYEHVRIAVEHLEAAEQEIALDRSLSQGTVSIGASEVALRCLLLPVLKQFRSDHPGVRIRVSNHSTPQALDALKHGLVDFAVVTTPTGAGPNMKEIPLRTVREVPVCGQALSHLAQKPLSLKKLSGYPLIGLGRDTKTYEMYTELFLSHGIRRTPDIEAATEDQILPMVKNDLGIGFVPEDFVRHEADQRNLFVLELSDAQPSRQVCLVKTADRSLSFAAKALEKMLIAERSDVL